MPEDKIVFTPHLDTTLSFNRKPKRTRVTPLLLLCI